MALLWPVAPMDCLPSWVQPHACGIAVPAVQKSCVGWLGCESFACPLQVAILYALHNGLLQGMEVSSINVPLRLSIFVQSLRRQHAPLLREIAATQQLSGEAKSALKHALADISAVFSS